LPVRALKSLKPLPIGERFYAVAPSVTAIEKEQYVSESAIQAS
jgi:hypothetical protein